MLCYILYKKGGHVVRKVMEGCTYGTGFCRIFATGMFQTSSKCYDRAVLLWSRPIVLATTLPNKEGYWVLGLQGSVAKILQNPVSPIVPCKWYQPQVILVLLFSTQCGGLGKHIHLLLYTSSIIGYVEKLLAKLWMAIEDKKCTQPRVKSPPPLSAMVEHPVKSEAIREHKSRFLKFST